MDNLQQLLEAYHEILDEFFLIHQESLLIGDYKTAQESLDYYAALMRQHIDIENEHILLLFERHVSRDKAHWPASLYRHEHNKVEQLLLQIEKEVGKLGESTTRRDVIALLENEGRFKNVIEHHEQREEMALLPELQGQLKDADHQQLILNLKKYWPSLELLNSELEKRSPA